MFALYLTDCGPNRLAVINTVARLLRINRAEAKDLVSSYRARLTTGDAKWIAFVRRQLVDIDAAVLVDYFPEGMNPQSWVSKELSVDHKTCRKCGASLFFVIPGKTTEQEIAEFAKHGHLPGSSEIARDKWLHPGVYCPNGCGFALVNFEHPDIYTGERPV